MSSNVADGLSVKNVRTFYIGGGGRLSAASFRWQSKGEVDATPKDHFDSKLDSSWFMNVWTRRFTR